MGDIDLSTPVGANTNHAVDQEASTTIGSLAKYPVIALSLAAGAFASGVLLPVYGPALAYSLSVANGGWLFGGVIAGPTSFSWVATTAVPYAAAPVAALVTAATKATLEGVGTGMHKAGKAIANCFNKPQVPSLKADQIAIEAACPNTCSAPAA